MSSNLTAVDHLFYYTPTQPCRTPPVFETNLSITTALGHPTASTHLLFLDQYKICELNKSCGLPNFQTLMLEVPAVQLVKGVPLLEATLIRVCV